MREGDGKKERNLGGRVFIVAIGDWTLVNAPNPCTWGLIV
jgi:hypothetical protein